MFLWFKFQIYLSSPSDISTGRVLPGSLQHVPAAACRSGHVNLQSPHWPLYCLQTQQETHIVQSSAREAHCDTSLRVQTHIHKDIRIFDKSPESTEERPSALSCLPFVYVMLSFVEYEGQFQEGRFNKLWASPWTLCRLTARGKIRKVAFSTTSK